MIRKFLSSTIFIHFLAILGGAALYGYIATGNQYILLGLYFSLVGAICGAFIRVIDTIKNHNK